MRHSEGNQIFNLVGAAIRNIRGSDHHNNAYINKRNIDAIMGPGFFNKLWMVSDSLPNCVTTKELELLKRFAGSHGYAIWKAWKARREQS